MASYHIATFGGHWSSGKGDPTYLICYVTWNDYTIKESCDYFGTELFIVCHHPVKFGGR